jgi:AcrR family transcriptional regulator
MTVVIIMKAIPSRREAKKEATRQRIIEAGVQVFTERGIQAATVDEIAAAADVGKGTIYNYFETKEDIVVAFMVDIEKKIQREAMRLSRSSRPLVQVLTDFVLYHLKSKERYHGFVRVFMAQIYAGGAAFFPRLVELETVIDPPLETMFTQLRDRGLIRSDIALGELILLFKTLQIGLTSVWVVEGPPWKGSNQLARQQVKVFCEGIGKGGSQ